MIAGGQVEALHVAPLFPHAHQPVEPIELGEHGVEGRYRAWVVCGPERDLKRRAHREALARQRRGFRGRTRVVAFGRACTRGREHGREHDGDDLHGNYWRATSIRTFSTGRTCARWSAARPCERSKRSVMSGSTSTCRFARPSSARSNGPHREPTSVTSSMTNGAHGSVCVPATVVLSTMVPRGRT